MLTVETWISWGTWAWLAFSYLGYPHWDGVAPIGVRIFSAQPVGLNRINILFSKVSFWLYHQQFCNLANSESLKFARSNWCIHNTWPYGCRYKTQRFRAQLIEVVSELDLRSKQRTTSGSSSIPPLKPPIPRLVRKLLFLSLLIFLKLESLEPVLLQTKTKISNLLWWYYRCQWFPRSSQLAFCLFHTSKSNASSAVSTTKPPATAMCIAAKRSFSKSRMLPTSSWWWEYSPNRKYQPPGFGRRVESLYTGSPLAGSVRKIFFFLKKNWIKRAWSHYIEKFKHSHGHGSSKGHFVPVGHRFGCWDLDVVRPYGKRKSDNPLASSQLS